VGTEPGTLSNTETMSQFAFALIVYLASFPVLFNDAHNCYVYAASVTEECVSGIILTGDRGVC
jgi:hypothetical protein